MKSTICQVIAILLLAIACTGTYALQTNNIITATVTVQGAFMLSVNSDSFDFARLAAKQTGEMTRAEGITVTGTSSSGNPWYLKVAAVKPLTAGSNSIPNDNFTWYGTSEGTGSWNGAQEKTLADNNAAYVSTATESSNASKIASKFKFRLHVPEDVKPGNYTTIVMFTMTE